MFQTVSSCWSSYVAHVRLESYVKNIPKRVENRPESLSQIQTKSNQKERRIHHEKIVYDRALALSALWQGNADQFGISTEQGSDK